MRFLFLPRFSNFVCVSKDARCLCLISRVLKKLVLAVIAIWFIVFMEGWTFRDSYSATSHSTIHASTSLYTTAHSSLVCALLLPAELSDYSSCVSHSLTRLSVSLSSNCCERRSDWNVSGNVMILSVLLIHFYLEWKMMYKHGHMDSCPMQELCWEIVTRKRKTSSLEFPAQTSQLVSPSVLVTPLFHTYSGNLFLEMQPSGHSPWDWACTLFPHFCSLSGPFFYSAWVISLQSCWRPRESVLPFSRTSLEISTQNLYFSRIYTPSRRRKHSLIKIKKLGHFFSSACKVLHQYCADLWVLVTPSLPPVFVS